ncbi:MAG: zinc-binding alcohol dehydrogenase [Terrimicrobiaceae bacterium]|nr:zinc-binding alcohol dehydrogenase [Terrimicrobiaceae bacterium]
MKPTKSNHAVQFIAKEEARLAVLDADTSPLENDQIEGRTLFSLISPGSEVFGLYTGAISGGMTYPTTVGYAAVFEIESVGSAVASFKPGDVVFAACNHQSKQRVKQRDALLIPNGLAPEIALFARFAKISMPSFVRTRVRPPETAIVTGLGIVGLMAAQLAKLYGYDVIGCDLNERRQEIAQEHGIARTVSNVPDAASGKDHEKAGLGIDCSGHEMAVLDLCRALRAYGEVFLVGVPWVARTDLSAQKILHAVFYNYISLQSGWEGRMPEDPGIHSNSYQLNMALNWLAQGKLNVHPSAFQIVSPTNPQERYQDILHNRLKTLSVVFDWRGVQ